MKNYLYYPLLAYCFLNRIFFEYGPIILCFFVFDLRLAMTILGVFVLWNVLGGEDRQNLTAGLSSRFRFVIRKNSPAIYDKDTRILTIFYDINNVEVNNAISDFVNGFFCALKHES